MPRARHADAVKDVAKGLMGWRSGHVQTKLKASQVVAHDSGVFKWLRETLNLLYSDSTLELLPENPGPANLSSMGKPYSLILLAVWGLRHVAPTLCS